jgi:hypothetical protein
MRKADSFWRFLFEITLSPAPSISANVTTRTNTTRGYGLYPARCVRLEITFLVECQSAFHLVVHAADLRTTSYGNLPNAYVEIQLGQLSMRTDTVKRSARPSWDHVFHLWVLCGSVIANLTLLFSEDFRMIQALCYYSV